MLARGRADEAMCLPVKGTKPAARMDADTPIVPSTDRDEFDIPIGRQSERSPARCRLATGKLTQLPGRDSPGVAVVTRLRELSGRRNLDRVRSFRQVIDSDHEGERVPAI